MRHLRFLIMLALTMGTLTAPAIASAKVSVAYDHVHGRDALIGRMESTLLAESQDFDAASARRLATIIHDEAQNRGIDPLLILAIIRVESGFQLAQKSGAGARGLMQLLPSTAKAFADESGVNWQGRKTLFQPENNVRLGITYFSYLLDRFDGRLMLALTAYNQGPTRVASIMANHRRLPQNRLEYGRKVRRVWKRYRDALPPPAVG